MRVEATFSRGKFLFALRPRVANYNNLGGGKLLLLRAVFIYVAADGRARDWNLMRGDDGRVYVCGRVRCSVCIYREEKGSGCADGIL